MANRWKNSLISTVATTPSSTKYTGRADGVWSLNAQIQSVKGGAWTVGSITPPLAPTISSVIPLSNQLTVNFTAPSDSGGGAKILYTIKDSTNTYTVSGTSSPLVLTGLLNNVSYSFTMTMTDSYDQISPASNSVSGAPTNAFVIFTAHNYIVSYSWSEVLGIGTQVSAYNHGLTAKRVWVTDAENWVVIGGNGGFRSVRISNGIFGTAGNMAINDNVYGIDGPTRDPGTILWARNPPTNSYPFNKFNLDTSNGAPLNMWGGNNGGPSGSVYRSFFTAFSGIISNKNPGFVISAGNGGTIWANITTAVLSNANSYARLMGVNSARNILFYSDSYDTTTINAATMNSNHTLTKWSNSPAADTSACSTEAWETITFNNANTAVAIPNIGFGANIYRYYSSSWGTKYSEPTELSTVKLGSTCWTKTGTAVICNVISGGTCSLAFRWSDANGFGTKYADPTTVITGWSCVLTQ